MLQRISVSRLKLLISAMHRVCGVMQSLCSIDWGQGTEVASQGSACCLLASLPFDQKAVLISAMNLSCNYKSNQIEFLL